jgi:hypothetical protein
MKKLTMMIVLMFVSAVAMAETSVVAGAGAVSGSGAAIDQGIHGDNSGNATYQAVDVSRAIGAATAPNLATTLTETSTS